ncbi:MAG: hypothetical protein LBC51_01055 [Treponema sp.]|nr:hypothetical protein [Treponema sp.]
MTGMGRAGSATGGSGLSAGAWGRALGGSATGGDGETGERTGAVEVRGGAGVSSGFAGACSFGLEGSARCTGSGWLATGDMLGLGSAEGLPEGGSLGL